MDEEIRKIGKQKGRDFQTGSHCLYYIQGSLYITNLASHFLTTYVTTVVLLPGAILQHFIPYLHLLQQGRSHAI